MNEQIQDRFRPFYIQNKQKMKKGVDKSFICAIVLIT